MARIDRDAADYPEMLRARLGVNAPDALVLLGEKGLLRSRRTALFCSARTPGDAILRAHDAAGRMRDKGVTVISGFHSPIEKDCLRILLRGKQPIIICPARAIDSMRVPADLRSPFDAGRVLFLSPFVAQPTRVTRDSAIRRNEVVAAFADEAYIAHVSPGGVTASLVARLRGWGVRTEVGSDE
jgi:predicted Rossmann fold nucleotide-binding protein DprA/Smf involved in DNA uptake